MKKRKVYIVTANDYLIYQPTILNLYDELTLFFDVAIVSFEPNFISKKKDEQRNAEYIHIPFLLRFFVQNTDYAIQLLFRLLKVLGFKLVHKNSFYQKLQVAYLKKKVRKLKADIVIAVDIAALYICQNYFHDIHFLSLEIYHDDPLMKKIKVENINSVFIQNLPRFEFLFGTTPVRKFLIQNAPTFKESYITDYERSGLVWAGSIVKRFAVLDCIDFIREHREYNITLKGGAEPKTLKHIQKKYQDSILDGQIKIDQSYLITDDFIDYLSHFRIGFCFYSWELIKSSINYQTAPSGKLFMCMAAGVPVIASKILGFQFIQDYNAGVLVEDYRPETIKQAILTIESDYQNYRAACYRVARDVSFHESVQPYLRYLLTK
jgi:glycosyltransferase involved in cell wall biosynthesis